VACSHGDVPVPELLDVEAAAAVPSAAVSHEAELWQFLSLHAAWTMPWLSGQSSMLEGLNWGQRFGCWEVCKGETFL